MSDAAVAADANAVVAAAAVGVDAVADDDDDGADGGAGDGERFLAGPSRQGSSSAGLSRGEGIAGAGSNWFPGRRSLRSRVASTR